MDTEKIGTALALSLLLVLVGVACSVEKEVILAQKAVDQARLVHSDRHAPYQFFSAEFFLAEARHQLISADFDRAEKYARASRENAHKAGSLVLEKGLWPDSLIDPASIYPPPVAKPAENGKPADVSSNGGKKDFKNKIHLLEESVQRIARDGGKECAPREFAAAEAHLEFARDDLFDRRFISCTQHLACVESNVKKADAFIPNCREAQSKGRPLEFFGNAKEIPPQ